LRLQNSEESANIWLVLAIQTVMPVGYTILLFVCKNKAKKSTQRGESSQKCFKRAQRYHSLGMQRSLFVN
jgi:hypothetical protein